MNKETPCTEKLSHVKRHAVLKFLEIIFNPFNQKVTREVNEPG